MIHPGVIACCSQQSGGAVYTTNLGILELQYDSFKTANFGGSVFGFPAAMAVGPDGVVVGTSSAINPGMGSMNVFSIPFDTGSPLSGTTSISGGLLSTQSSIRGMVFAKDGEKLYVGGQSGTNLVQEYTLSSPYDISTASSAGTATLGTGLNALQGIAISGDGTKFYAMRSTSGSVGFVREYAMGTAFDITSLSTTRDVTAALTGNWGGGGGSGFATDIAVSPDQSKITIASLSGTSNNFQSILDEWPLTDGNISPISSSTDRKSKNFSRDISDSWDSVNDDALTYVQAYNFTPDGQSLILAGIHMDDGGSGSSNQFHITRWVD